MLTTVYLLVHILFICYFKLICVLVIDRAFVGKLLEITGIEVHARF